MQISMEDYVRAVIAISIGITISSSWLASMMIARILANRVGINVPDIGAVVYVLSTVAVFAIIALRYGQQAPPWLVLAILLGKFVSCLTIAVWVYLHMRRERL